MKGKRYTTEQKIRTLREAERTDKTILDVCRERQISEQTFHRWKREFGMMEVGQAKQLKELQKENARLKRMPSSPRSTLWSSPCSSYSFLPIFHLSSVAGVNRGPEGDAKGTGGFRDPWSKLGRRGKR